MDVLRSPARLFRTVAVAEALTWALLLLGMVLKYLTRTTDVAVTVFGMLHGVVFLTYAVSTVVVWVDQRWSPVRAMVGLLAAVPPFATIAFDLASQRQGLIGSSWRLREPGRDRGAAERVVARVLRRPVQGLAAAVAAVAVLTVAALAVGPPVG